MARRPDLARDHQAVIDGLWDGSVDPRVLELCRLRTAKLIGSAAASAERTPGTGVGEATIEALDSWPTDDRFSPIDRACLAYAEQFVLDVHGITGELTRAVVEALGEPGMVTFTTALAAWELSHRFDASLGSAVVPTPDSGSARPPGGH